MSESKTLKVVVIVSPYQLVVNGGEDAGLKKGERVLVYGIGEMIKDPETGENLEQIEIVRGTGKIVHLQGKIATIESDMREERPVTIKRKSGLGAMASVFGETEETEINREDVPFDDPQVGDHIRIIS
ncbi:hypothetical protein BTW10_05440 [Chromohalobacter japonicus]|uniref:Uncharacterized protein n=1 Tax=Chromohalobacter japonicus TaxID=223900 RepID=A0A1Q8TF85_9GAMM|nr:hypothetical protein [Chromohalobacter japonicus]OLO12340.1 hypothetical protein BTW10_05440 [Chromohalobacter japonicus]